MPSNVACQSASLDFSSESSPSRWRTRSSSSERLIMSFSMVDMPCSSMRASRFQMFERCSMRGPCSTKHAFDDVPRDRVQCRVAGLDPLHARIEGGPDVVVAPRDPDELAVHHVPHPAARPVAAARLELPALHQPRAVALDLLEEPVHALPALRCGR